MTRRAADIFKRWILDELVAQLSLKFSQAQDIDAQVLVEPTRPGPVGIGITGWAM